MLTDNFLEYNMTLLNATEGKTYTVKSITTGDSEFEAFLFSLGCYSGEPITVVRIRKNGVVLTIKDGRYNVDLALAGAIEIE